MTHKTAKVLVRICERSKACKAEQAPEKKLAQAACVATALFGRPVTSEDVSLAFTVCAQKKQASRTPI